MQILYRCCLEKNSNSMQIASPQTEDDTSMGNPVFNFPGNQIAKNPFNTNSNSTTGGGNSMNNPFGGSQAKNPFNNNNNNSSSGGNSTNNPFNNNSSGGNQSKFQIGGTKNQQNPNVKSAFPSSSNSKGNSTFPSSSNSSSGKSLFKLKPPSTTTQTSAFNTNSNQNKSAFSSKRGKELFLLF